jgi:zinc transporter, ZIP family
MPAGSEWFIGLHPIAQALLAGLLTWAVTAAGAALVFPFRSMSRALLDAMLGFAAGVMIAASVWSLLLPAIELAAGFGSLAWAPAACGVVAGALALRLADALLPHLHLGQPAGQAEGAKTTWRRTTLLVLAITLHNAPEGLAVGVAFGAAALGAGLPGGATLGAAVALAIGIAIQNVPEGVAVAMPLRREGMAPGRCFWYGQLSAAIEPVAAVLGAAAVLAVAPALPYALAFAAGAMLFVVVEELIPASQQGGHADLATSGAIAGFTVMMVLDVALG